MTLAQSPNLSNDKQVLLQLATKYADPFHVGTFFHVNHDLYKLGKVSPQAELVDLFSACYDIMVQKSEQKPRWPAISSMLFSAIADKWFALVDDEWLSSLSSASNGAANGPEHTSLQASVGQSAPPAPVTTLPDLNHTHKSSGSQGETQLFLKVPENKKAPASSLLREPHSRPPDAQVKVGSLLQLQEPHGRPPDNLQPKVGSELCPYHEAVVVDTKGEEEGGDHNFFEKIFAVGLSKRWLAHSSPLKTVALNRPKRRT